MRSRTRTRRSFVPSVNPLVGAHDEAWPGSGRRSLVHAMFDGVVAGATCRSPKALLGAIDALSPVLTALNVTGPTPEQIVELYGRVPADAREIAWRSAALRFKNHAALALLQKKGLDALAERVSPASIAPPAHLVSAKPAILLSCHVGVHNGVSAALRRWGLDAFMLPLQGVDQPERRTIALRNAIDVLRGGGRVLAVMDGPFGSHSEPVACLGRRIVLRRGAFALARLTGAPVLPAVARWNQHGDIEPFIDVALQVTPGTSVLRSTPPSGDDYERELTTAAARWLERYLIAYPEEAWPYTIANFLQAPPTDADAIREFVRREVVVS